ncbi:MAG: TPM domain-containing protein, partial [Nitrospirales bacterium]|nr:TPM domain-containing protein [Nitrospirales bacterium]
MPRLTDHWIAVVALGLILSFSGAPHAATATAADRPPIPQPLGYVTDEAGILNSDWTARIRSVCQDLERKTGVEMVVVTVKNLAPYRSANEYASTIYQRWGVGSAQREHGIVILAAIEERRAAVTVGKPLVGRITAPMMEDVGRQYV